MFFGISFHALLSLGLSLAYFIYPIFSFDPIWKFLAVFFSIVSLVLSYVWVGLPVKIFPYWFFSSFLVWLLQCIIWSLPKILDWNFFSFLGCLYILSFFPLSFLLKRSSDKESFFIQYRYILISASIVVYTGLFSFLIIFINDVEKQVWQINLRAISETSFEMLGVPEERVLVHGKHGLSLHEDLHFSLQILRISDFGVTRHLEIISWEPKENLLPFSMREINLCVLQPALCRRGSNVGFYH